jgi:hypothetical protein
MTGPWSKPQLARGFENRGNINGRDPYSWNCATSNVSPFWLSNGSLVALARHDACWTGEAPFEHIEHLGAWRADSVDGVWEPILSEPIFGIGNGSLGNCSDRTDCPRGEDPFLWHDNRGWHVLFHDQNLWGRSRGGYGWSTDMISWTLETAPELNGSAWNENIVFRNGTSQPTARRQKPSLIFANPGSSVPTHLINGADFWSTDGSHWGDGFTVIQQLNAE